MLGDWAAARGLVTDGATNAKDGDDDDKETRYLNEAPRVAGAEHTCKESVGQFVRTRWFGLSSAAWAASVPVLQDLGGGLGKRKGDTASQTREPQHKLGQLGDVVTGGAAPVDKPGANTHVHDTCKEHDNEGDDHPWPLCNLYNEKGACRAWRATQRGGRLRVSEDTQRSRLVCASCMHGVVPM